MVNYDTLSLKYRQPFDVTEKLHNRSTFLLEYSLLFVENI